MLCCTLGCAVDSFYHPIFPSVSPVVCFWRRFSGKLLLQLESLNRILLFSQYPKKHNNINTLHCWIPPGSHSQGKQETSLSLNLLIFTKTFSHVPHPQTITVLFLELDSCQFLKEHFAYSKTEQTSLQGPGIQKPDDHTRQPVFKIYHTLLWYFSHPPSLDLPNGLLRSPGADDVMEKWNTYCCRVSKIGLALCSFSDCCPLLW